ncbi:hypothetical protein IQ259_03740 [Fortiea sp. LEGE XX443]|uniref:hypothetical protein n=1 Tax=Fortiea sp. LEGE XX443 TaxID=1828611 RepID=UPI00187E8B93|nr:hypothetical protein [Fortiea sp. LEGE XX443]MBE9004163.1 hypothetical protein [Fortiea sp. LEGE XX443]
MKLRMPMQARQLRQYRFNSILSKFRNLLRSPSVKVGSALSGISVLLIISPLLFQGEIDWLNIWQNMGFNLLGAVCTFIAFDVVFYHLKELDEQQGVELDYFNKSEFISIVKNTKIGKRNPNNSIVTIRILETWTELLRDNVYKEKFTQAILQYIENNSAEVEILLLNPENKDLVAARFAELQGVSEEFSNINIAERIYINLREIQEIIYKLAANKKEDKLKVKLYNISQPLAIYMCTPNLFVTFFRSGKLTTMGKQLRLPVDSPVATFINERFDEIWQDTRTISLENCLYVKVEVIQRNLVQGSYDKVKYILCEQGYYIQNTRLFQDIANKQDIQIKIKGRFFKPTGVAMDDLHENVRQLFLNKYPSCGELFIYLS